jgi:hypothetical protein
VDDLVVAGQVVLDRVRRLVHLAEEALELAVGDDAVGLDLPAGLGHGREQLHELIDAEDGRHGGLRHGHVRDGVVAAHPEVELRAVDPAAGETATDGERERRREHRGERLVVQVLVEREERVALQQVGLAEVAELVHRRVVLVERERGGLVAHLPAGEVHPPAEVDVLVEHEVAVVEAAELLEHVGAHEHGRAGAEEHVALLLPRSVVRPTRGGLVAHAVPGHRGVGVVDVLALPVEHLARHGADVGPGLERGHGRGDPLRVRPGVVVEEGDDLAGGVLDAEVAAAGEPAVGLRLEDRGVLRARAEPLQAVVARAVLDDENLQPVLRPVQLRELLDAGERVVRTPEIDQDHGDDPCATLLHKHCLSAGNGHPTGVRVRDFPPHDPTEGVPG